jgi:outer membrane protein assembly factor BamA/autotransporter translocation and assembly factor TamB
MKWWNVDAGEVWKILLASYPGAVRVAPGSIIDGTFQGRWPGWDADLLEGRLDTTWRRRPSGPRRGEILWYDGRIVTTFARGPWTIDVDALADSALGLKGRLFTRGSARDYGDWPITGRLALSGSAPAAFRDGLRLTGLELETPLKGAIGEVNGEAVLSRTFRSILSDVSFDGSMRWVDQPPVHLSVKAAVDPDVVKVTEFTAESGPSRAHATSLIDLNRDTIDADFTAREVPAESWTRRFEWPTIATGPIDVQGTVSGPLRRPLIAAAVSGGPMTLVAIDQRVDGVTGQVQFHDGLLRVDQIDLSQAAGGHVTGTVTFSTRTEALDATADIRNFAFAARIPGITTPEGTQGGDLRAVATGTARVSGTSSNPVIEASFASPQLALDGRSFGTVEGKVATANDTAQVDVTAGGLGTRLTGTVALQGDRPFNLTAAVNTPDSALAATVGSVDVEVGAMQLEARATGRLNEPSVSSLDVTATRLDVSAAGLSAAIQPGAHVEWQPSRLEVSGLHASVANTAIDVSGILDGNRAHRLSAAIKGRLDDLLPAARAVLGPGFNRAVLEGPLDVALTASGTPQQPTVVGSLAVDAATLGDGVHPPLTNVWIRTVLDHNVARIDLAEMQWQGAHTAVSGSVPAWFLSVPGAPREGRAAVRGHLDDVTIKVLEPLVSADALGATDFNIRLQYSIEAAAPSLDSVIADARVTDAVIRSRDLSLEQQGPGHLTLRKGVATLDPWTIAATSTTTTQVTVGGLVSLLGSPTVDAKVDGRLDLRTLSLLFGTYRPAGTAIVNARVVGPLSQPNADGFVTLEGAELLVRSPRLLLSDINGTARFAGDQISVEHITGTVNGGALDVSGKMQQLGRGTPSGALAITVRGALFEIPRGFRSSADADLQFAGRPDGRYGLSGTATITDAAYRESLLTGGLAAIFRQQEDALPATTGPRQASAPSSLVLDIRVLANDSIIIDTSLTRVAIGTNLRVAGPISNIRLSGHADVAPGGQLFFGGHTYQIESGIFDFRPSTLRPDARIVAHTTIGGYEITMRVESRDGNVETTLNSDPPLPEDEVASLMLSGQRTSTGSAGEVVTAQLMQALSGEIVGAVGRAIGFDAVRVESGNPADLLLDPTLLSTTTNPAQRITFSKRVFPNLEVIFSQSLRESGDITYVAAYEPFPHFEFRFAQLDNRDRSYEIRNDLSFGGGSRAADFSRRRPTEVVRDVYVAVFGGITEEEIRGLLRITEGRHFDFYKWQRDRDRLQKFLVERGFYEFRLTARRDPPAPQKPEPGKLLPVDLGYTIETGPPSELRIVGMDLPDDVRRSLIQLWQDTPVDSLLGDEFTGRLQPWLAEHGYLRPKITTRVIHEEPRKVAEITIAPGPKYDNREVVFAGNNVISGSDLKRPVTAARIEGLMWSNPTPVEQVVADAYRARGYRAVKATAGEPRLEGNRAELPVTIVEGPLYRIGKIAVHAPPAGLEPAVDLTPPLNEGDVYTDNRVADATRQIQTRLRRAGYRGNRVQARGTPRKDEASTVDLTFDVTVGRRLTVGSVKVAGVTGSRERLVSRLLPFKAGQPVLLDDLTKARERIYDTDVFRSVDIESRARPSPDGQPSSVADVTVNVEPLPKYRLRYGFQLYDPTTPAVSPKWGAVDPGVVADLTRRGLFGRGITGGVGVRLNPSNRLGRAYLSSNNFLMVPLETTVYFSDQWQRAVAFDQALEDHRREWTFEQRFRQRHVQFAYGYDFERIRTDVLLEDPLVPEPEQTSIRANVGRAFVSAVVDARDNAIDTRRGWFHSSSYELAPEWLGSTLGFRKYLGQQFIFLRAPGTTVVLGSAARFEVATGPGQDFIITERLRAGGANTVRGYDDVILGQLTTPGNPNPKTGLVVLNQELRFPLFWRFRGATFYDHAVLFGDIEFAGERNRNSVGGGVRLTFPFLIFRVDYGYPLSKDAQNQDGRWYFSIGQAF